MAFQNGEQVVVRRKANRSGARTNEVRVGVVVASQGEMATVSIPGPGGRIQRANIPVRDLEPVTARFKRSSVQFNPTFRNIAGGQ